MGCGKETVPRRSEEDDGQIVPLQKKYTDSFYRSGNLGSEKFSDLLKVTTCT